MSEEFEKLKKEIKACTICAHHLPLGPRPVMRGNAAAKILVIGQAPGTKVHASGVPWDDKSGERLRDWMGVKPEDFYDENRIAIMPMGFCYPGRAEKGGDLPPRPECAPQWHDRIRGHLSAVNLTLLVGSYAQKYYLGKRAAKTMTETVKSWQAFLPDLLPTPHPSWRSGLWLKKNPWFETDVLPVLQKRVKDLI